MIIDNKNRDVLSSGLGTTKRMSLNMELEAHYIKTVTEFQYRNALASVVRELSSNAVDIHEEVGQTLPVIVSLQKNANNRWEFSVQDFGSGLDEEEFYKYIMGVGESTKRDNPKARGGWGAGCKCWTAYNSSCTYICRKDGKERQYLLFKGEEVPEALLVTEQDTTEQNGVIFKIELQNNYNEYQECIRLIKNQLSYFPNIYFNVAGLDNTYTINRNELFEWNTLNTESELHISLKQVYYPINWASLGIAPIHIPIAIRFDDYEEGIKPILSREEINWLSTTKELVKGKIKLLADWFAEKYNDSVKEMAIDEIPDKWESLNPSGKKLITIEGKEFEIGGLLPYMSKGLISPKIKGIDALKTLRIHGFRDILLKEWQVAATGNRRTISVSKNYAYRSAFSYVLNGNHYSNSGNRSECRVFSCEKVPSGIYREYLQDEVLSDIGNYVFLRKTEHKDRLNWYKQNLFFKQDGITKDKWRTAIKEFLAIRKAFESKMEPLEAFQITDAWRDARKANRASSGPVNRTYVKKEEVNLREVVKGVNKDYVLAGGSIVEVDNLEKEKLIIYGLPEEKDVIGKAKALGLSVYCMAQRDLERIQAQSLPNWMSYSEYMKGETTHFKDKCLYYKKLNYSNKLNRDSHFIFMCSVDPWMSSTYEWFNVSGNTDNYRLIIGSLLDVARKKEWWWNSEADIKFAIVQEVMKTKDLSFLEEIKMNYPKGPELAKEVYFNRIKNKKEYETTPHQGGKDYR